MEWLPHLNLYPAYLRPLIRAGRGIGSGQHYLSWLRVSKLPTRATLGDALGIRTHRPHELGSDRELIYLWLRERDHDVIDIRENFPILFLSRTLELFGEFKATHPSKGGLPQPLVITSLITRRTEAGLVYEARSIRKRGLDNIEEAQSLQVIQRWCEENGVDWKLVDTAGFKNPDVYSALLHIRHWFVRRFQPEEAPSRSYAEHFLAAYQHNEPLGEMQARVASKLLLKADEADDQFRFCAWARLIDVDVTKLIALNQPLYLRQA